MERTSERRCGDPPRERRDREHRERRRGPEDRESARLGVPGGASGASASERTTHRYRQRPSQGSPRS
jgi:hypothetical protein